MNKSNMSWDQAFQTVNESAKRSDDLDIISNNLYPREDGVLRDNFIGLSNDQRDHIYGTYALMKSSNLI
jgi:hypothetical protein